MISVLRNLAQIWKITGKPHFQFYDSVHYWRRLLRQYNRMYITIDLNSDLNYDYLKLDGIIENMFTIWLNEIVKLFPHCAVFLNTLT